MDQNDPYNLQRFVEAQRRCYGQVCSELKAGRKASHWMWFIFPQCKGLGQSPTADLYGIASRREAEGYLVHPVLGPRLMECTQLVNDLVCRTVEQIFGDPDNLKFRSSMTLFANVAAENPVFLRALAKYFNGKADQRTIDFLKRNA